MCYLLWGLFWSATSLTLSVFEAIKLVKNLVEQKRELCCGLSNVFGCLLFLFCLLSVGFESIVEIKVGDFLIILCESLGFCF